MTVKASNDVPGARFIPRLESTRGVAALLVAMFHTARAPWRASASFVGSASIWHRPVWGTAFQIYDALSNGPGAVIFFFVLSGYVLALSLERKGPITAPSALRFFALRLIRLYPAIFSTTLIFTAVYWVSGASLPGLEPDVFRWDNVVRNMLLLVTRIDGVMWTMQLEALAAPVILVTVMLHRRSNRLPILLALILVVLSFCRFWRHGVGVGGVPLGPLYAFLFGILVHSFGKSVMNRLKRGFIPYLYLTLISLFFAARPLLGMESTWSPLVEACAAAGLIAALVDANAGPYAHFLDYPFFRFFGKISYSFYLLHPLALVVIWAIPAATASALRTAVPALILSIALAIISTLAIAPLAWMSWRYIEMPAVAWGRRFKG